jgi:membrane protease YdiL (CAAX protease family)
MFSSFGRLVKRCFHKPPPFLLSMPVASFTQTWVNDSIIPPAIQPPIAGVGGTSRRRWWIHLLLLGSYPLLIGAAGSLGDQAHQPVLGAGSRALLLICGFELLVFAVVFGLAWLASRASLQQLFLFWRGGLWIVPASIGYSVVIRIGLVVLIGCLGGVLVLTRVLTPESLAEFFKANQPQVEALVDVSALRNDPLYFWLSVTVVSFIVAGLREELWRAGFLAALRVLWPGGFGSLRGQTFAVAVGSVIFGLGHLIQGPLAVLLTTLLGFALGMIIVLHRSIWPAVIAHGMFDATTFALLPWIQKMEQLR